MRVMNDHEFENFRKFVKCNWHRCAAGMGMAGQGKCVFNGMWNQTECPHFISDEEYEKRMGNCNADT